MGKNEETLAHWGMFHHGKKNEETLAHWGMFHHGKKSAAPNF
jgi:hypothetical protein